MQLSPQRGYLWTGRTRDTTDEGDLCQQHENLCLKNDEYNSMIRSIEGILDIPVEEHRQTRLPPPLPCQDTARPGRP